jgi:hypothetical protein
MTLMRKVQRGSKHSKGWITRYPVIRLAKLALWALQSDCVASAWRPCNSHVCGAVAISTGKKRQRKAKNRAQPQQQAHKCSIFTNRHVTKAEDLH